MRYMKSIASASMCAMLLAGCANYQSQQEQSGMVIGGVLGGVLGSQVGRGDGRTTAIILGTLAGAAIGGSVGRSMAETDKLKTAHALENVRTGVPTSWKNPDTGNEYMVVPTHTYDTSSGPCRETPLMPWLPARRTSSSERRAASPMAVGRCAIDPPPPRKLTCLAGTLTTKEELP